MQKSDKPDFYNDSVFDNLLLIWIGFREFQPAIIQKYRELELTKSKKWLRGNK